MADLTAMLQAAAGNAGGDANFIEDMFSCFLYTGNGSTQTIDNGIDLAGEGGLVWIKQRNATRNHRWCDTVRGAGFMLASDTTGAQSFSSNTLVDFNVDGFDLGGNSSANGSGNTYVSWTFRKQPKFFDVVTYTGTGVANRQIAHNIGGTVGFILIKRYDSTGNWLAWHRSVNPGYGILDLTEPFTPGANGFVNAVTDTYFETSFLNTTGATYVAYLFAHDAGGFGLSGEDNVISCGSYTADGSGNATVNLGFEPQFVLDKLITVGDWRMFDNMRGIATGGADARLLANDSSSENNANDVINLTSTGFSTRLSQAGDTYIYIAIRRGPMKVPETGTSVFAMDAGNNTGSATVPEYISGFPVDFQIEASTGGGYITSGARLIQGKRFFINKPAGESEDDDGSYNFAFQNGWFNEATSGKYSYMLRRTNGAFDVVCYNGNGSNQTIAHNLNVVPELIFTRRRDTTVTRYINVYNKTIGATKRFQFRPNAAETSVAWNNTEPTSSVFSVGNEMETNNSGSQYIAWMFASVPGVIKVGSYIGTGSDLNINCGFSSGARFILIKGVTQGGTGNGGFYLWDSLRGIVTGNDPYYRASEDAVAVTTTDYIDPFASGFAVTSNASSFININGNEYIFLAIA